MAFDELVRCRLAQSLGARDRSHRRCERAVCPASADAEDWSGCVVEPTRAADEALAGIRVPREGQWMARVWLQDAAGNEDRRTAQSVPLNLDSTPPSVAFAPFDDTDPTRIDVHADDATSPLVRTEIEARRRGDAAWIPLPTSTTTTGFSSRLDDETLPNGKYALRARAIDSAGNERSTHREVSGKVALRTVPMRVSTRLVAGQLKIVKGRRTRGGRRRTRRVIVVRPKVRFGRTIPIRGRLTTAWRKRRRRRRHRGVGAAEDTRCSASARRGDRYRRLWSLHVQGSGWTEPHAAIQLSGDGDRPRSDYRGRHPREGVVDPTCQPASRRQRRGHRSARPGSGRAAAGGWQARSAPGILAR